MKIKLIKYIGVALLATSISSCKIGEFGDINVSPNSASSAQTSLLLTNVERNISGILTAPASRLYIQHLSESLYTSESRYNLKIYDYSAIYNNPLEDLTMIIALNSSDDSKSLPSVVNGGSNANQIAVARILKAFLFLNMTDRWGDVPYSEALKGVAKITPKFDTQQSIYTSLFKELKEAVAQIDGGTIKGDFLLGNSLTKWKLFANTMRLHMALRLSKVDATNGKSEFNAALASGVLNSNSDNIFYTFLAESTNENNIYNNYEVAKRYDYVISKTMVDALAGYSDPRLPVYADKTAAGTYVGMPYGLTQAQSGAYLPGTVAAPGNISLVGKAFRSQNSKVAIYTYDQVQFAKAEAYKLGWITGVPDDVQAATAYISGITATMATNGVVAPATYFTQAGVVYDPINAIKQIITQKWIGNFMGYGVEAWSDWRRTGFPLLSPSPVAQNIGGQIPRRQVYTTTELDLNKANYNEVITRQGADELSTRVWWDKP